MIQQKSQVSVLYSKTPEEASDPKSFHITCQSTCPSFFWPIQEFPVFILQLQFEICLCKTDPVLPSAGHVSQLFDDVLFSPDLCHICQFLTHLINFASGTSHACSVHFLVSGSPRDMVKPSCFRFFDIFLTSTTFKSTWLKFHMLGLLALEIDELSLTDPLGALQELGFPTVIANLSSENQKKNAVSTQS